MDRSSTILGATKSSYGKQSINTQKHAAKAGVPTTPIRRTIHEAYEDDSTNTNNNNDMSDDDSMKRNHPSTSHT